MFGFIALSWAITFGVVPTQMDAVGKSITSISQVATVAQLDVSALAWDRVIVYGSVETYQYLNEGKISFSPYRADYVFGAEIKITEGVAVGVAHECDHPVSSKINLQTGEYTSGYNYGSSETKIYLRIDGATE